MWLTVITISLIVAQPERPRKRLVFRPLGGFVRCLQFGQVHREVENDLNGLCIGVSVVVAIHVYLHLPTVSYDATPPMLK